MLQRFWAEEEGMNAVEYGLIGVLIVMASIASLGAIRVALATTFTAWAASM